MRKLYMFLTLFLIWPLSLMAKDHLTLGVVLEPPHLDPTAGAAAAIDEITYANIFEGLTRIMEDGSVAANLAKNWTISEDGLIYNFHLHDSVSFHNGNRFNADNVIFSLKRAMSEKSVNAQKTLFEAIDQVERINDYQVKITLKRPNGDFLFNLGWGDAAMLDAESADDNKKFPIGTGPFRFDYWRKGSAISLNINPDYWGEAAKLQTIEFRFIAEPAAAFAALMAGDIDMMPNFPAVEMLPQLKENGNFTIEIGSSEGETILAMNHANPALANLQIRRAIALGLDRDLIINGAMDGYAGKIGSHFAPHHPAYVDLTDLTNYDPKAAKALLQAASVKLPLSLTLKLPPPAYARRSGEIIAAQLREIGIHLEIIPVEWAIWIDQVFKNKDYDLTIISHTEPMDIGIYARDDYYFNYQNADFNTIMDDLKLANDEASRYRLYQAAQRKIAEDQVNGFLFQLPKIGVWSKNLQDVWHNAPIQANDLTKAYWSN